MMNWLHYILGPVVGAVIGMVTNYLAIIMLFRPLKPVKIGKFTLPFTPGIIPKHQSQLADALADTVAKNFFTNEDIEGIFLTDEMCDTFAEKIYEAVCTSDIKGRISEVLPEDKKEDISLNLKAAIYARIHLAILDTDISGMVSKEAEKIIKSKTGDKMLAGLLLSGNRAAALSEYIGKEVESYVYENDLEILAPILEKQGDKLKNIDLIETLNDIGIDRDMIIGIIKAGYIDFMRKAKSGIAETFHIREFIHDKIMELNPADIEFLVNQAIKKEMNYLVYLGGGLGFIIGLINSFF